MNKMTRILCFTCPWAFVVVGCTYVPTLDRPMGMQEAFTAPPDRVWESCIQAAESLKQDIVVRDDSSRLLVVSTVKGKRQNMWVPDLFHWGEIYNICVRESSEQDATTAVYIIPYDFHTGYEVMDLSGFNWLHFNDVHIEKRPRWPGDNCSRFLEKVRSHLEKSRS